MRNLFSLLCLLAAGLLGPASLAGHQIDQLLRDEQPITQLAGSLPQKPAFSQAVAELVVAEAAESLPAGLQQFIPGGTDALLRPVIDSALDDERTAEAWHQVLQNTRSDYTAQLEELFAQGTTGDPRELDLSLDLSPVTDAMTQPLREGLEEMLVLVPGLEAEDVEIPTPTFVIDIEAATDETADPYTWAAAAGASRYWEIFGISAALLTVAGLLLSTRRARWYSLAAAAVLAAGIGLWIAATAASPQLQQPAGLPEAGGVMLDHLQIRFTDWAQPAWWIFTGAAGFVVVVSVLAAVVTDARREQ